MNHSPYQRRIHSEFGGRGFDFVTERFAVQRCGMPVDARVRIAGITVEVNHIDVGVAGASATKSNHAIVILVAEHDFIFGRGSLLTVTFYVGELHRAISMHDALDAIRHGGHRDNQCQCG